MCVPMVMAHFVIGLANLSVCLSVHVPVMYKWTHSPHFVP